MHYGFDDAGGFYAFSADDAAYAYPTSTYAKQARKNPETIARSMLTGALAQLSAVNPDAAAVFHARVLAKAQP